MRILIIILLAMSLAATSAIAAEGTSFDAFLKSREVVATLYFPINSDTLTNSERQRVASKVEHLRKLQKNGRMIRVEGFSSTEGDKENNFKLSFFRARTVADLISAKGLPAEVTLTGYGDLRAETTDHGRERRVEIASYVKPVGLQKVKVAHRNKSRSGSAVASPESATKERTIDSLSIDQALRRKLEDRQKDIAERHGEFYPEISPGVSKVPAPEEPIIDALTIEQAIMEKIGATPPAPSGTVSQANVDY